MGFGPANAGVNAQTVARPDHVSVPPNSVTGPGRDQSFVWVLPASAQANDRGDKAMANDKDKPAEESVPAAQEPGKKPATSTPEGAPTDEAHREVGDGTLQGSVPAGLTADQLRKLAEGGQRDDGGTG
jgi:hypothetical protein